MKRALTELTQECELTAQMYISGLEKKEIASLKYKAVSTINNQLQEAFQKLNVKNGRELCRKFYERLSGIEFTFDFSPVARTVVTCCLLFVLVVDYHCERVRLRSTKTISRVEIVFRSRARRYDYFLV